ncbi:MAG: hypothetical protein Q8R26_00480 [bacterium]|nr:hypothetical protein [bacterium]
MNPCTQQRQAMLTEADALPKQHRLQHKTSLINKQRIALASQSLLSEG